MKKATLHDVASAAGVSTRTVSRVVNDEDGFSDSTRQKVQEIINELGYRPNLAARSLVTKRTNTFGFVVSFLTDPFFPALADGVIRAAREIGHTVFVGVGESNRTTQREVLDSLAAHGVDAVIVFPAYKSDDDLRAAADSGLPIVVVDHIIDHPRIASVASDIRGGAVRAATFLRELGHEHIGMLAHVHSSGNMRRREAGFKAAMGGADAPIIREDATIEGGGLAMRVLLNDHPDLTAVVAYNDLMAIGAIAEIERSGRSVPDDISVVGFDDIPLAEYLSPSLTTVRLNRERVGAEAVNLAVTLGNDPDARLEPVIVPVSLMDRASTAPIG